VTPHRVPITPGVTIWNSITTWPSDPTPPTGFEEVFIGWQNAAGMWLDDAVKNQNTTVHAAMHFYARWGTPIFFDTNGGIFSGGTTMAQRPANVALPIPQPQIDSIGIPTRGGATDYWTFGRWNVQRNGLGAAIVGAAPPAVTGSPISGDIPLYAANQNRRTVFAQWDGVFNFNLMGGRIGSGLGSDADRQVWIPDGFTISQANAATNLPVNLPPSPAPNHNIAASAVVPNNPAHDDPSMVFVGWRTTSLVTTSAGTVIPPDTILTRADVANILMNGLVNPAGPADGPRTAPTGRINLEAVWQQRLVFTKTGEYSPQAGPIESQYLTHPDTNNASRVMHPRDGAVFRLDRNTGTSVAPIWTPVTGNITSGDATAASNNQFAAVNSDTGNLPFAAAIPASAQPGLVVMNITVPILPIPANSIVLTAGGQYRLYEVEAPLGYMREGRYWLINMHPASTHPDARIQSITAVDNPLYFVGRATDAQPFQPGVLQNLHVGNRRHRFTFTKHNERGEPLDGAVFALERYNTTSNEWDVIYTTQPSGTAIPHFPGQQAPALTPPGTVMITTPLPYNIPINQLRLREITVPAYDPLSNMPRYIVPMGHWYITTNRSGVVFRDNAASSNAGITSGIGVPAGVVPPFTFDQDTDLPANNVTRYQNRSWYVRNTRVKYWPFIKTDHVDFVPNAARRNLPGAHLRLFVFNGPGSPPASHTLISQDMVGNGPGEWSIVENRISSASFVPQPMWFPMMPGRYYQLVEMVAPVGFQLPWEQWSIEVMGAVDADTIQGQTLEVTTMRDSGQTLVIADIVRHPINVQCAHMLCVHHHPYDCASDCSDGQLNTVYAYHIRNFPEFDLPLAGGLGDSNSLPFAVVGSALVAFSLAFLLVMRKRRAQG